MTDLELGDLPDGIEVVPPPVELGPWAPHEVLLVSDDEALLADAPHGVHRLLGGSVAAVRELVELLNR